MPYRTSKSIYPFGSNFQDLMALLKTGHFSPFLQISPQSLNKLFGRLTWLNSTIFKFLPVTTLG